MVHKFFDYLRSFRRGPEPLIKVLIYKDNLLSNYSKLKQVNKGFQIAPVLKSNAYGHGMVEVARIFDRVGVPFFAVDSYYEARVLRRKGIESKILVIGYLEVDTLVKNTLKDVSFAVTSLSQLQEIHAKAYKPLNLHIKVDTGMHRQGIPEHELGKAVKILRENDNLVPEGLMSHLADADGWYDKPTKDQLLLWSDIVREWKRRFSDTQFYHIRSTNGTRYNDEIQANVIRTGIGLYGVDSALDKMTNLQACLAIETVVSGIKNIAPGDKVGYNFTFDAPREMRIATIPMGYYEGIDRRLSNTGEVLVHDVSCDIIGKVSMNITTIDVSKISDIKRGDRVIVVSNNKQSPNSVQNIALKCNTIPYEIFIHIPAFLRREVV